MSHVQYYFAIRNNNNINNKDYDNDDNDDNIDDCWCCEYTSSFCKVSTPKKKMRVTLITFKTQNFYLSVLKIKRFKNNFTRILLLYQKIGSAKKICFKK